MKNAKNTKNRKSNHGATEITEKSHGEKLLLFVGAISRRRCLGTAPTTNGSSPWTPWLRG